MWRGGEGSVHSTLTAQSTTTKEHDTLVQCLIYWERNRFIYSSNDFNAETVCSPGRMSKK